MERRMDCESVLDDRLDELYGEADAAARKRVLEHLSTCAACRDDMAALRTLRGDLAAWSLPAGYRAGARHRAIRGGGLGKLAVAAMLLVALGAALGLSGAELRYGEGRVSFRLGRGRGADVEGLLARQEARHRQEMDALRATVGAQNPVSPAGSHDDAALLRRVEERIRDSEARQAVVLNAGLADLAEKTEAQRRYDLARISAGLSYLDGQDGQQMARTAQLVGYVLQASEKK